MAEQTLPSIITRNNQMVWKRIVWSRERVQVWFGSASLFLFLLRPLHRRAPAVFYTNSVTDRLNRTLTFRCQGWNGRTGAFVCERLISLDGNDELLVQRWHVVHMLAKCTQWFKKKKVKEKLFASAYSKSKYMSHPLHSGQGKTEQSKAKQQTSVVI